MLKLKEGPDANHVRDMALYFNAELDEGNDSSTIRMDNDQAKGFISSYRLFDGLTVWVYNITFAAPLMLDLTMSQASPYYFSYNVQGDFLHRFSNQEEYLKVLQSQNMLVIGGPSAKASIILPENVKLRIAVIVLDVNVLGSLNIRNAKRISSHIHKIFHDIPKERPYRYLGKICEETKKYASIVCENNQVDLIGSLITEGAVLNMLASQLNSFVNDDQTADSEKATISKLELSKITNLSSYIIENIETNFTIDELSNAFRLSPKKLQSGVRYLYGDTLGNYVSNLRMGHARHLFITTEYNVSEVCHKVGFSSKSYFSKLFKDRYDMSPKTFRRMKSEK